MLENIEVVLRPYDQTGREGGKEGEREAMKEKRRRGRLFLGGGRGEDPTGKNPPPSGLNRVALNGHCGCR